jgi:hypothetical protein
MDLKSGIVAIVHGVKMDTGEKNNDNHGAHWRIAGKCMEPI